MGCSQSKESSVNHHVRFHVSEIKDPFICKDYPVIQTQSPVADELHFYIHIDKRKKLACSLVCPIKLFGDESDDIKQKLSSLSSTNAASTYGKKVIILCHGFLSWRNQMLITNLSSRLSNELSCYTLRFDFTANGHSTGSWSFSNYEQDFKDLCDVLRFVECILHLEVLCIIGHSQGSMAAIRHASLQHMHMSMCSSIPNQIYVNLAGRYKIPGDFQPNSIFSPEQCRQLQDKGEFIWSPGIHKGFVVKERDLHLKNMYDLEQYVRKIPDSTKILTIHGADDAIVPIENAFKFEKMIKSHFLSVIPNCNHNFNGLLHMDTLVSIISKFVQNHSNF